MYQNTFYATHPDMMIGASQADLRARYLVQGLFEPKGIRLNYLHQERLVIGGVVAGIAPVALPDLEAPESLKGQPFLNNREMGVVNIGTGVAVVQVDGQPLRLLPHDALYIPRGTRAVSFAAEDAAQPVRLYLASTPAHREFPLRHLPLAGAKPLRRGAMETSNARTIYQLIIPGVCESAQLLLGLTVLDTGSVWNTMPPHTHDRRSEAYFYFNLADDARVFHFMGQPDQMRHIVVNNEEAVICPPWSVHTGAGTSNYAFIWAMGGENLDYDDMDQLDICQLA